MRARHYPSLGVLASVGVSVAILGTAGAQVKKQEYRIQEPGWLMAGQTAVVKLYGQDLTPNAIRFESPGITGKVLKAEPFSGKSDWQRSWGNRVVEVEVTSSADVKPGLQRFTLTGEGMEPTTGSILLDIVAPEVKEAEPNNDLRKPQVLPDGPVTVMGKLDGDGADVFRFNGKAGETWRVEVFARRLNREVKFEPLLRLRDPRLAPIRAGVDQGNDCAIEVKLPTDGPYLIELFDADNRSAGDYNYRLTFRKL